MMPTASGIAVTVHENSVSKLKRKVASNLILFSAAVFLLLFLPAGSLAFWEGWAYFVLFTGSTVVLTLYFFGKNPQFIERRLRRREKLREQKCIQTVNTVLSIVAFMIPGLDYRFNWSQVPVRIVVLGDVMVVFGYLIMFTVFKENVYASSVVEVEPDQQVVSTGPYAIVRHPLYLGAIVMMLFTPLALGSYWALIPFLVIVFFVILRLLHEERFLLEELTGYEEYAQKIRCRLIPFVW